MENTQNYQPKTLAEANHIILSLLEKVDTIAQQNESLQHQLNRLLRLKYGQSSEKLPDGMLQLSLLTEPPKESVKEIPKETITYTRSKRNNNHHNIPDDLPRVRIEYKLENLSCPCGCGKELHKIGEVITEQLEIVPAKIYVKEHVRFKYAGCLHQNQVITAPMPRQPIDKGLAGPGLLADVLVKKYDDHIPLHRQSEILARHGINIAKQTLCEWVMQCADILKPLIEEMKQDLFASPKIHTDDTVIPVLTDGEAKTKKGRLWCYVGCDPPLAIYDYSPDHKQKWAGEFLKGYEGYLQADAYTGYDKLYVDGTIIEVACMAHARRKFFEIIESSPNKKSSALTALDYIGKLYKVETKIKHLVPMAKEAVRKREAKPILKEYKKWLMAKNQVVLPKCPLGQAIAYTLNNWIALTRYLGDGILAIDNNQAERLMRPVTVGRANWTFAGNDRGGKAAAVIYSLIESSKLSGQNPYEYLVDILTRTPNTLNRDIRSLLPYVWQSNGKANT